MIPTEFHPFVAIDIETTGLDPKWCQTLEVGAVVSHTAVEDARDIAESVCRFVVLSHSTILGVRAA